MQQLLSRSDTPSPQLAPEDQMLQHAPRALSEPSFGCGRSAVVYGAQDTVLDAWGDDSQAVTAHEDYRVVCRSTIFGFGEIGGERLTEVVFRTSMSWRHLVGSTLRRRRLECVFLCHRT
jgi:hypothetical protein